MARPTIREVERYYLEQFRKHYDLPPGVVEYSDKPDVRLNGAQIIGVEIARLLDALNNYNAGVLDDIPVTLTAGNAFTKKEGNINVWPNDGTVNVASALAQDVPDNVIKHRTCHLYEGGTHHIYTAQNASPPLPLDTAITWNRQVGEWVTIAINSAGSVLDQENRRSSVSSGN